MDFQPKEDRDHRLWLVSASETFAIGVQDYLFGQKCIQVLYREMPGRQWWVIQEWRTYEAELVDFLVSHIKVALSVVDPNLPFGQWQAVESLLPPKEAKYLEDEVWFGGRGEE